MDTIVTYTHSDIAKLPHKTASEWQELEKLPITFDEDCPPLTQKEISEFRRVNPLKIAS